MTIPAITLWQPWATLMVLPPMERKEYETRSWAPAPRTLPVGSLLAIHAAKRRTDAGAGASWQSPIYHALWAAGYRPGVGDCWGLPLGAVVGVVRYLGAISTDQQRWLEGLSVRELHFGDFSEGRWAWLTELVLRLEEPIPARGGQGIWRWEVPPEVEKWLQ